MHNSKLVFLLVMALLVGVIGGKYFFSASMDSMDVALSEQNQIGVANKNNCLADDCLLVTDLEYPVSELPDSVVVVLNKALDDEYKALATYQAVMEEYGSIRPFIMIARAEEQHIASLKAVYDKYGLAVPTSEWDGQVSAPASVQAACQTGVEAEIANAALYRDELLPAVSAYEDITLVFTNLMNASQEKHLGAFERCN